MANASKKNMGSGAQGKGAGVGAMTELPEGILGENMVLSNHDKARHSDERGLDSRAVQTEQYHDHAGNRRNFDAMDLDSMAPGAGGQSSGGEGAMTDVSASDSSLASDDRESKA